MMNRQLAQLAITLLFALLHSFTNGQSTLITQPLNITSTCPGSTISVPFTYSFTSTANTRFTVQLSDGGEYFDIPTNSGYQSATIPKELTPGRTYSVRMTSKNPDVVGTPSPTKLVMKGNEARPPAPLVDSLTVDCMSTNQSSMEGMYSHLNFKLATGATPRLYYDNQRQLGFREDAELPYQTKLPTGEYVRDRQSGYFLVTKTGITSTNYVYPVGERVYYMSQRIDGCESEAVADKLRIIWTATSGPSVINPRPNNNRYGQVTYCQGERSYPLNVNGHGPPPENFQVIYWPGDPIYDYPSISTLVSPIPNTSQPGSVEFYTMNLVSIDASKGCSNWNYMNLTHISVYVKPIPTKPTATTSLVQYYQGQLSQPLSATTTDSTATLIWYGTNATGGTGSSIAPQPATNQIGDFTYYVAQKVSHCEGERTAITVRINPLLGLDDVWLEANSQVYPNPVASRLTVQIGGVSAQQPASLDVLDLTGRSLQKYISSKETSVLSLEGFPSGSYFLLIRMGSRQTVKRIVKQ